MSDDKIIPFGKYKGQKVEVLLNDPQYVQWMLHNGVISEEKNPSLYQVVINNFAPPSEDTPAHNALQVRFLDDVYRAAFWQVANLINEQTRAWLQADFRKSTQYLRPAPSIPEMTTRIGKPKFEDVSDVVLPVTIAVGEAYRDYRLAIEIKPCVGDDYPVVLRQIKRQQIMARHASHLPSHWFLLIDQFTATNVTLDQVRAIFAQDDIRIVLVAELP